MLSSHFATQRPEVIDKKLFKSGLNKALKCRQDFFTQRIVNSWNSLPKYVVNAKSVNSFKSELDNYWKRYGVKTALKA